MMLDESYSPLPNCSLRPSCVPVAARRPQILRPDLRHDPHLWNWELMTFAASTHDPELKSTHSVDGNRKAALSFPIQAP